jgi:hypothetical protein
MQHELGNMITSNVPKYLKKKSNPFKKSSKTKQSHKSSYIILKGLLDDIHDEHAKAKINAF